MVKRNKQRRSCKDVFNAFLVEMASFVGLFEFPKLQATNYIPNKLIPFSKALSCKDYDQWIHFYEDDVKFERIWRNPQRYLPILKRYNGVILPDFSVYRDMPYIVQLWNIYRSRAIGVWLQNNGVKIIVNIRYADKRTYRYCGDGVSKHSTIAVGTHGTIKNREDRYYFCEGLDFVVKKISPTTIVVYGSAPKEIFDQYQDMGIVIVQFDSEFTISHLEDK